MRNGAPERIRKIYQRAKRLFKQNDFILSKFKTAAIATAAGSLLFCASCAGNSDFVEPARERDAIWVRSQSTNPSYRFDEELFRLIAEAQRRGDPLSRDGFKPILNAAATLAKSNASYPFMSPLGEGVNSELGARIMQNGHFKLKLTIGRDSFLISGKCDCGNSPSGNIKCAGKLVVKTGEKTRMDANFETVETPKGEILAEVFKPVGNGAQR